MVDKTVLDGVSQVKFLYREAPFETEYGEIYPDSGWRIRSKKRAFSEKFDRPAYVALGAVLNRDDSWLHLIDKRLGSVFERDPEIGWFAIKVANKA